MTHRIALILSITVFGTVLFLMLSGSPILTTALDQQGKLPLGNPITAVGLMSFPALILLGIERIGNPENRLYLTLNWILRICLILAASWLLIAYLLAGNWNYTFTEKQSFQGGQTAMKIHFFLSYSLAVIPLFVLIVHWFNLLGRRLLAK